MHVVAILELGTPVDAEAKALAADLGTTAYEERLKLVAGLPAIVLQSAEAAPAHRLLASLRARGHGALAIDSAEVIASTDMIRARRLRFEPDALVLRDSGERLPYDEISALIRAIHRTKVETRVEKQKTSFSLGRALATGGVMLTKTTTSEEKNVFHDRDALLYVFRGGATPWIVHERSTDYSALGPPIAPSSGQNFLELIARLRLAAPHALYDERLVGPASAPMHFRSSPGSVSTSSATGVDLVAHLLARWARRTATP